MSGVALAAEEQYAGHRTVGVVSRDMVDLCGYAESGVVLTALSNATCHSVDKGK
jgi:hypothetical protein